MLHLCISRITGIARPGPEATVQQPVAGCQGQQLRGKGVYVSGYRQLGPHMWLSGSPWNSNIDRNKQTEW